MQILDKKI